MCFGIFHMAKDTGLLLKLSTARSLTVISHIPEGPQQTLNGVPLMESSTSRHIHTLLSLGAYNAFSAIRHALSKPHGVAN